MTKKRKPATPAVKKKSKRSPAQSYPHNAVTLEGLREINDSQTERIWELEKQLAAAKSKKYYAPKKPAKYKPKAEGVLERELTERGILIERFKKLLDKFESGCSTEFRECFPHVGSFIDGFNAMIEPYLKRNDSHRQKGGK